MTDFTATRTAHWTGFTDRIRREVVEVHVLLFAVFFEGVDHLCIAWGTKRTGCEDLRLATREQTSPVNARQETDFTSNLANVCRATTIRAAAFRKDKVTQLFLDNLVGGFLEVSDIVRVGCLEGIYDLIDQ